MDTTDLIGTYSYSLNSSPINFVSILLMILQLGILILVIYLLYLVIKALKIYIKKHS